MAFALLPSSSRFRTSSWIMVLFSLGVDFDHCWKCAIPRPCLPVQGFPMMSLVLREHSAWLIAVLAAHLRPDLVLTPASLVSWSRESLYVRDSLHLATLNSSTTDDGKLELARPNVEPQGCKARGYSQPSSKVLVELPLHFFNS